MNKYVVSLENGRPICTVTKKDKSSYTIDGYELIQFLLRIDETLFDRKDRKITFYNKMTKGNSLSYISRLQGKNIRIDNYEELMIPLKELYKEYKSKIRKQDEVKYYRRGASTTGVIIGGVALALLGGTRGKQIDIENTANFRPDVVHEITIEDNTRTIDINIDEEEMALSNEEIESIVTPPVIELDQVAVYDQGIYEKLKPFEDMIRQEASIYGISYELMYDIISQEYGEGTNLTHVVFDSWIDNIITVHNFDKNRDQTLVMTDHPENYLGKVEEIITRDDLKNPRTNIAVGAILLQTSFKKFDYNMGLGIQAYNNGITAVNRIIKETAVNTHKTREEIIANKTGIEWMDYTYIIESGDPYYFANVVKHINESQQISKLNDVYSVKYIQDGEEKEESIQFKLSR